MRWSVTEIKLQISLAGGDKDRRELWRERLVKAERHQQTLKTQRKLAINQAAKMKRADHKRMLEAEKEHREKIVDRAAEAARAAFGASGRQKS